jgi:hypothetical protein
VIVVVVTVVVDALVVAVIFTYIVTVAIGVLTEIDFIICTGVIELVVAMIKGDNERLVC